LPNDIIGMDDMNAIFEVTDGFGIDRETISVPLERAGAGNVIALPDGSFEIVAPADTSTRDWLPQLQSALEKLGLEAHDEDEESWLS